MLLNIDGKAIELMHSIHYKIRFSRPIMTHYALHNEERQSQRFAAIFLFFVSAPFLMTLSFAIQSYRLADKILERSLVECVFLTNDHGTK